MLKKEKVSQGNLFCYILDETSKKESLVKKIAELNGLKPFYVKSKETPSLKNCVKNIDECVIPGVLTWIQAFKDAELVVTDSFHGCVFSIIFNKPFWVFINSERGSARFDSLLSLFNLEDRIISIDKDFSQFDWNRVIDWSSVNHLKTLYEEKSICFLQKHLKTK